ncbi:MAG: hypothetical protein GX677_10270 [Treponema sp.]|jgi:endoglucanase|nr:hypothetical protein [Treponema sp.]
MKKEKPIFVNQIGFKPKAPKSAFISESIVKDDLVFYIVNFDDKVVYKNTLQKPKEDRLVGEKIYEANFSDFTEEGVYRILCNNVKSYSFKINYNCYDDLLFSVYNFFKISRCGEEIKEGDFARPACHTASALIYGTNEHKAVKGGWHDAGDYGRYIVNAAKAVMDMLLSYNEYKAKFSQFNLLKEIQFELEWMLQMQREDGAVYHKISCYHFCGFINPQDEKDEIVISPISTTATADFAGTLAYASLIFKEKDEKFAEKLLEASVKAQNYLDNHVDELYKNPPAITTGEYGDDNATDERYFALCSLFVATEESDYLLKAKELKKSVKDYIGWGNFGGYGTEILLKNKDLVDDKDFISTLQTEIISLADEIVSVAENSPVAYSEKRVYWGCNGGICDNSHILFIANSIEKKDIYLEIAQKQLSYLLGCNPISICYVTGNGEYCSEHTHHRPSVATGKEMKGMLSGGPTEFLIDDILKKTYSEKNVPPLKRFLDDERSYSSNEIAINWNSGIGYLITEIAYWC